jgi:N-acetyltransferase
VSTEKPLFAEMVVAPVVLEGRHVRLEPLREDHLAGLATAGLDEELWRWIPAPVRTVEEMAAYIATALREQAQGASLPFALVERKTGRPIGSTRYGNIDRTNHRVEIGWTWVTREWQRTAINTEAKYLLLKHAFETLGCIRVELKTDSLNERSRAAILRIGAREEGIFRNHMITASGRIRHTVYFSIVDSEWPSVKARLETRLDSESR